MIRSHDVKSPTCKAGWSGKPVEIGPGGRDHWDGDRIETLIKEKLMMRTKSGNGQVWEAFRLFTNDGDQSISPEEFKQKVGHLLNTKLTDEEIFGLFQKYDDDGSGEITIHEFVAGIFPADFPIRSEVEDAEATMDEMMAGMVIGEVPATRGYGGHVPGNRDVYGRSPATSSPRASPVNSPQCGVHDLSGMGSPPISPGGAMGAYPAHMIEPEPEQLLSPKWKRSP